MCFDESFGRSFGWVWGYFVTFREVTGLDGKMVDLFGKSSKN